MFAGVRKTVLTLALLLMGVGLWTIAAWAQDAEQREPLAATQVEAERIVWLPNLDCAALSLRVVRGAESILERRFEGGINPSISLRDTAGNALTDGIYRYELRAMPLIDGATQSVLEEERESPWREEIVAWLIAQGKLPSHALTQNGTFSVENGAFVVPDPNLVEEPEAEAAAQPSEPAADPNEPIRAPDDVVQSDDVLVMGSLGVGFDSVDGQAFGFDTIILKENNLRILFDDTSATDGFPSGNWRITINDSPNGGANYFSIDDVDNERSVFKIVRGARPNALYIDDAGRIGLGTAAPVVRLHIADGNTPAVRLDQDGSGGWAPQIWDVAGNEANFFIRDMTNGSKLCMRIQPDAPTDSLTIKSDGDVGIGTWQPAGRLHVVGDAGHPNVMVCQETGNVGIGTDNPQALFHVQSPEEANILYCDASGRVGVGTSSPTARLHVASVDGTDILRCENSGGVTVFRALSQASDVNLKENFVEVDGQDVLDRVAALPIRTWNYKADKDAVRHIGPMAQDFYAAFGLNDTNLAISPMDLASVAIGAIQRLNALRRDAMQEAEAARLEQARQIEALEQRNASLEARLAALEQMIKR